VSGGVRLLGILLGLLDNILSLTGLLLENLLELLHGLVQKLLALGLVLLSNLLELLELGQDLAAIGDHLEVLIHTTETPLGAHLGTLGLGLLDSRVDVTLKITSAAGLNAALDLLEQLLGVALLESIGVFLDDLLNLGVLVEVGLGLLETLRPCLVTELLDLLDLLLDDLAGLVDVGSADTTSHDFLDLVPGSVNLLLDLGAVLVTHGLELLDSRADSILELGVVLHEVLGGIGCQSTDLLGKVAKSLGGLAQALAAEARLGDLLELAVGLSDDLVDIILVVLTKSVKVLEGSVDVLATAGDPSDVRVGELLDVVDGVVGIGSVCLDLVAHVVVVESSILGGAVDLSGHATSRAQGVDGVTDYGNGSTAGKSSNDMGVAASGRTSGRGLETSLGVAGSSC
jgi:hypothetical protein